MEYDLIEKRGSWYRYEGEPIGQGTDAAIQFLEEDEKLAKKIEAQVRERLMPSSEPEKEKKEAVAEDEEK